MKEGSSIERRQGKQGSSKEDIVTYTWSQAEGKL